MEHGRTEISIVAPAMIPDVLRAFPIDIGSIGSKAANAKR
jgi:hypothetical protein